jgi:D-glycero-alpha-D-manno-heptose-7-phosphate kinase
MYAYRGVSCKAEDLALEACEIEIEILGKPIGKQDQYIAAYGGFRFFRFRPDGSVAVEELPLEEERRRRLGENLMLFFTGMTRSAAEILHEQRHNVPGRCEILRKMKEQTVEVRECLGNGANLNRLGRILDRGWELKRQLASRITNCALDEIYQVAVDSGAVGGKICGAGGGGFLLLCCPPDRQPQVRAALAHLKELPFGLERDGTKVIFNVRR